MDRGTRSAILVAGLGFCLVFTWMTLAVAFESGFDIFSLAALAIIVLIALGLAGAIRNPPEE